MDTEYNGEWKVDRTPPLHTDDVTCQRCGRDDLRWVFSRQQGTWRLYEVGPWYTGRRLTLHECHRDD